MVTTWVTKDGRVPPVLVCIGNHEVCGGYHQGRVKSEAGRADLAPYFYSLFAFPGQPGYGVMDFGNYLSFVFGDSEHSNPIPGPQTDWMRETKPLAGEGKHEGLHGRDLDQNPFGCGQSDARIPIFPK